MIKSLKLKNFRNFSSKEFFFDETQNIIIGENGLGKTNILEAIGLFSGINLSKIDFDNLVNKNENIFFIELELKSLDKIAISYDKENKKKKFILNGKNTTKKKIEQNSNKLVFFYPIIMNIMYLSPSLRRDFLDEFLIKTFDEYKKILSEYKKVLNSRNKILKNIKEKKSKKQELDFWNDKFINLASTIYYYRFGIINFIKENTNNFTNFFNGKINKFEFNYKSKISFPKEINTKIEKIENIKTQLKKQIKNNLEKDLISSNTNIGPHIDDFEIILDGISLTEFASRGEVKTTIIGLKLLEIKFIEKHTNKKPILLIDDLLSELDDIHKNILMENIKGYQVFITSIKNEYEDIRNIIKL